jgi:hypothetical protein
VKQVDAEEATVRFYQEVFDGDGRLRDVHEKFSGRSWSSQDDGRGIMITRNSNLAHRRNQRDRNDGDEISSQTVSHVCSLVLHHSALDNRADG